MLAPVFHVPGLIMTAPNMNSHHLPCFQCSRTYSCDSRSHGDAAEIGPSIRRQMEQDSPLDPRVAIMLATALDLPRLGLAAVPAAAPAAPAPQADGMPTLTPPPAELTPPADAPPETASARTRPADGPASDEVASVVAPAQAAPAPAHPQPPPPAPPAPAPVPLPPVRSPPLALGGGGGSGAHWRWYWWTHEGGWSLLAALLFFVAMVRVPAIQYRTDNLIPPTSSADLRTFEIFGRL